MRTKNGGRESRPPLHGKLSAELIHLCDVVLNLAEETAGHKKQSCAKQQQRRWLRGLRVINIELQRVAANTGWVKQPGTIDNLIPVDTRAIGEDVNDRWSSARVSS